MTHISITHVVAVDGDHCIGKDNQLAWHIPADLQHFKNITTGGVIVMGRKTFESLGRPLPNRSHHVISRNQAWAEAQDDQIHVWNDLQTAINQAKQDALSRGQHEIFIIGGGQIYEQSLPLADTLHITFVDTHIGGDAFYPKDLSSFVLSDQSDTHTDDKSKLNFRFSTWHKRS